MPKPSNIDLRGAINAVSDVVQNRPRPLRELDQIYMKTGDMVLQSEAIARWADGKRLAFIGDGDAIGVCIAYMQKRGIIDFGPSQIAVFDFDERICGAVTRFAEKEGLSELGSTLYNCLEKFPDVGDFDCFYTNPPWGESNNGESVKVFVERGIESIGGRGEGTVVIADDRDLDWPQHVLAAVQKFSLECGFYIQRMSPRLHRYHLDDNPDLHSCNLMLRSLPGNAEVTMSEGIKEAHRLDNFYGLGNKAEIKYVRERRRVDYGKAHEDEYEFEFL